MFSVGVSDHIMVAHSLRGEVFGPAQRLHGATFEVRIELRSPKLDGNGIVADIGLLTVALREVLQPLNLRNLDDLPDFAAQNSTTEVLCRHIHTRLAERLGPGPYVEL